MFWLWVMITLVGRISCCILSTGQLVGYFFSFFFWQKKKDFVQFGIYSNHYLIQKEIKPTVILIILIIKLSIDNQINNINIKKYY